MRTKNLIWSSLAVMMAAIMNIVGSSCSDDDDDSVFDSMGVLDKESGLRIKSVGDSKYNYDSKGRIDNIMDASSFYEFTYNPNKILATYYYDDEEDEEISYSVSYNSSGYLSRLSRSDSYEDGSVIDQATLTYDSDGHLTKISGYVSEKAGNYYNSKDTYAYTFTWRDNKLLSIVFNYYDDDDYDEETDDAGRVTFLFSYDNNTYENVYRQWTPSLAAAFAFDFDIEKKNITVDVDYDLFIVQCLYLGLLGVGPAMLPSGAEVTVVGNYDGETYTSNYSYNFSYGFNNDGSVSYSAVDDLLFNFTYDNASADAYAATRSEVSQLPAPAKKKQAHMFGRMFKRSLAH